MLRGDMEGRVPFSLVAVIALLLAGVSSVYVATTGREASEARVRAEALRALEAVARVAHAGVALEVHSLAIEAVRSASSGPLDPRRVNAAFDELVGERLLPGFPRAVRGYTVDFGGLRAGLVLEPMQTFDAFPSGEVVQEGVPGAVVAALETARPSRFGETTRTPYFRVVGTVNYTVSRGEWSLHLDLPLSETVDSPFPLVQSAVSDLKASTQGSESELARIVRYVLTTAAQFRALQGYAAGRYGEPGTTVADLLTPADVEIAVNLALLLEEVRRFRAVDPGSSAGLDAIHFNARAGRYREVLPDVSERTMEHLLEAYARGGTADAADLFALYSAFDADPLRLNRVLAQALSAVVDQGVLRVFEYFGIEWALDLGVRVAEMLAEGIEDFLEWLTGESREAQLVRGFVAELFGMAGETTMILGPVSVSLPTAGEYRPKNEDGTVVNISVPAHAAVVALPSVDFLPGRNELWKGFYTELFADDLRAVHSSARDFLTDLASRVAGDLNLIGSIPNPALRGEIDPKDGESVLEFARRSLDTAVASALEQLRRDPSYLDSLVTDLWAAQAGSVRRLITFIEGNYDTLASKPAAVYAGRLHLAADLVNASVADPDYRFLDSTGLADLKRAILSDVGEKPWVADAYEAAKARDVARLERVHAVATSFDTPMEGGGIDRWLRDTVTGATGVLSRAGELLVQFGNALAESDDLHNTKVILPTPEGPFEFWSGNRTAAEGANGVRREDLVVRQTPATLVTDRLGGSSAWDRDALRVGDLWVDVTSPAAFHGSGGPNVHWTDVTSAHARPFESRWQVAVAGLVKVEASTDRGVGLGPDGHRADAATELIRIDLSLSITVYSGWPLAGVEYADSDSFAEDVWEAVKQVLGVVWRIVEPVVDWVIDLIHQAIEYLADLLRRVMTPEVVRAIYNVTRTVVEALQNLTLAALAPIGAAVKAAVETIRGYNVTVDLAGMRMSFAVDPSGGEVSANAWRDGLEVHARLVLDVAGWDPGRPPSLRNAPLDLLFSGAARIGDIRLTASGDALMLLEGRFLTLRAIPGAGGWAVEIALPEVDPCVLKTPWQAVLPPVPTPLGLLTLSVGIEIRYTVHADVHWLDLLGGAFLDALSDLPPSPSLEDVGRVLRSFLRHLIERLLDTLIHVFHVDELLFYLEGVFGAGTVGAGLRLAFAIDGGFLQRILEWIVDNLMAFLDSLARPSLEADYKSFPSDLLDYLGVRFEVFATAGLPACLARAVPEGLPGRLRIAARLQLNLPAIVNFWSPELGRWRVDFGIYIEQVPAPVADALWRTGGPADVWFLRGAVYET